MVPSLGSQRNQGKPSRANILRTGIVVQPRRGYPGFSKGEKKERQNPLNLSSFRQEGIVKFHEHNPKIPKCFQNSNLVKAKPILQFKTDLGVVGSNEVVMLIDAHEPPTFSRKLKGVVKVCDLFQEYPGYSSEESCSGICREN
ncbi:hypothetical protein DUI87_24707 [Hirundo rustica rustica]|uniref:Uncharacterized protein n=1 Tax=Hirundo rustica rustica TaxID=333673 RepID=A0A3M0JHL2_HIRRU|nr:hypothetical protein DUI87_24707 [Hirundo rustica rustica]